MSDDSILKGITPIKSMRIEKRNDPKEYEHEGESYHEQKKEEKNAFDIPERPELLISSDLYQIELGNLIIKKRNVELNLFTEILKEINSGHKTTEDYRAVKITQLKSNIYRIEKAIENLDPEQLEDSESSTFEKQLVFLAKVNLLYEKYLNLTIQESIAVSEEDYDKLEELMEEKTLTYREITINQKFVSIGKIDEKISDEEEKSKVRKIISEIKSKLKQIINQENQNSVNLKSHKKELMKLIEKEDRNVSTVLKYNNALQTSHFISTKK